MLFSFVFNSKNISENTSSQSKWIYFVVISSKSQQIYHIIASLDLKTNLNLDFECRNSTHLKVNIDWNMYKITRKISMQKQRKNYYYYNEIFKNQIIINENTIFLHEKYFIINISVEFVECAIFNVWFFFFPLFSYFEVTFAFNFYYFVLCLWANRALILCIVDQRERKNRLSFSSFALN